MRAPVGHVLVAALALSVAACSEAGSESAPPASSPSRSASGFASPPPSPAAVSPEMAIVGHATRAQLDLDRATARRIVAGEQRRVAGRRVLGDLPARRAIRAVERDPHALAVVPLDLVGPSVVAARVAGVDPVRDAEGAADVTLTGDIMLVRNVPDAAAALAPMSRRLAGADLTVGNLESTLSLRGAPTQGSDSFGGTPALLEPLRRAGFDALSLANNHAGDYGQVALVETVERLAASPIEPFGAGASLAEASRPAVLEVDGTSFAFVGFNAIGETPRAVPGGAGALSVRMPPRTGPLVRDDLDHVAGVVRRAGRQADVVVVLPHWGTQYTHTPEPIQREVSRRLVAAGADLVVGGHPHWVQGVDLVAGVPVVHSLGNFVFDMYFMEQTLEGVVLETTWWGDELKALRLVPYRMAVADYAPRVVDGPDILADVWGASTGPYGS